MDARYAIAPTLRPKALVHSSGACAVRRAPWVRVGSAADDGASYAVGYSTEYEPFVAIDVATLGQLGDYDTALEGYGINKVRWTVACRPEDPFDSARALDSAGALDSAAS